MDISSFKSDIYSKQTRYFLCPDGVTRIVTMESWFWYHFDWMTENKTIGDGEALDENFSIPLIIYSGSIADPATIPEMPPGLNQEERYQFLMRDFIWQRAVLINPHYTQYSNNNVPPSKNLIDDRNA